jgi:nucleotide-binding universal stress UspA family protein
MEETFSRILVTTDFSLQGDHAIGHAFRLAADHGAAVLLCHVVESVPPNPFYAHYVPADAVKNMSEKAEAEARQALLDRVPKSGRLASVPHEIVIAHGAPLDEIVRVAAERAVDLIVIATHGRTGVKHVLLGSVAERVIRCAPCPVLVVR